MEGRLIGVGVGPGDPELLTLAAVRAIRESDCILLPNEKKEECYAYKIRSCRRSRRRKSARCSFR